MTVPSRYKAQNSIRSFSTTMKSPLKHITFPMYYCNHVLSNQEQSHKNKEIYISKGILYLQSTIAFTRSYFFYF